MPCRLSADKRKREGVEAPKLDDSKVSFKTRFRAWGQQVKRGQVTTACVFQPLWRCNMGASEFCRLPQRAEEYFVHFRVADYEVAALRHHNDVALCP